MQARNSSVAQEARTFTENARRAQIVDAAIRTIAEEGYTGASFTRIARRAGLSSTGLISYHFAGKDELVHEVARTVLAEFAAHVEPRMNAETTHVAQLRAFVTANLEFMRSHREHLVALLELGNGTRRISPVHDSDVAQLTEFLDAGQRAGEFRAFDPGVMAVSIMALRDGVLAQLVTDPELDLERYQRELPAIVELITRSGP